MKIIQITVLGSTVIGLGDDGEIYKKDTERGWIAM